MELEALLAGAESVGLNIAIPLGPRYDEAAGPGLRLADLAPWARGGVLLLSGGGRLFSSFTQERERFPGPDPLDRWTRAKVAELLAPLRAAGVRAEARHPFWNEPDPLPFQRIGAAAGLTLAVPLGLTLHPAYGSWIAYRALVLLDRPLADAPRAPFDACAGCPAPCIPACPAGAVAASGWNASSCMGHRRATGACSDGCASRLACPVGAAEEPGLVARRFHQAASLHL